MGADVLHVDLDAFYASVERRRRPDLVGRPLVVGGDGRRGVVLSSSYEARACGVRNGMSAMRARRLCPEAVFVPPDFEAYMEASRAFRWVLESLTPLVEPRSLDEAFCDVSGSHSLFGPTELLARTVRARVRSELGLVCSVGAGPTKLVAKMASRAAKPDGQLVVSDGPSFLRLRPVEEVWGIGKGGAAAVLALGVRVVGDLERVPAPVLERSVGRATAAYLASVLRGGGDEAVEPERETKSVGAETTFARDVFCDDAIAFELLRLSDRVAARLVEGGRRARTITTKVRFPDFETRTRSTTMDVPTADVWTVFATALAAAASVRRRRPVRLVGVAASALETSGTPRQLSLDPTPPFEAAEEAIGRVRRRFGRDAVTLARLLPPPSGGRKRLLGS